MTYFNFLMEHAGAPSPRKVCVVAYREEWANRQIVDELRITWASAEVCLVENPPSHSCDLLVLPFDGDTPANVSAIDRSLQTSWIMIYGLENRRIWVFQKRIAISFVESARRFRSARRIL